MSISKKKVATSATAVGLAAMLLLGGTFAWQSISQTALNEASDVINPGGRLHDDFNGENKDVYVENFAEDDIFARIRLDEYFEIVQKTGTTTKVHTIAGTKDDEGNIDTWSTHYFDSDNATDEYWDWSTGGQKVFMPTFNKNKDSLEADINGTYYGPDNTITDLETDDRYTDYQSWELGDVEDGSEIYDADTNGDDEVGNDFENLTDYVDAEYIVTEDATHEAQETLNATLMSMQTWMDEYNSEPGEYWVYDTDGWVYWAQPIQKGEATGLLLDGISLDNVMDDSWYYAINVIAQFITADDLGYEGSTGFYADGESVTEEALALLEKIGVDISGSNDDNQDEYDENSMTLTMTVDDYTETVSANYGMFSYSNHSLKTRTYQVNGVVDGVDDATFTYSFNESWNYSIVTGADENEGWTFAVANEDTEGVNEGVQLAKINNSTGEMFILCDDPQLNPNTLSVYVSAESGENVYEGYFSMYLYSTDFSFEIVPSQAWYVPGSSTMTIALSANVEYLGQNMDTSTVTNWSVSGNVSDETVITDNGDGTAELYIHSSETENLVVSAEYPLDWAGATDGMNTAETYIDNGPHIGTMTIYDDNGRYHSGTYTAGQSNSINLKLYFFPNYTGAIQPIEDAYTGLAAELLSRDVEYFTSSHNDETGLFVPTTIEGVELVQNPDDPSEVTVIIDETVTGPICIACSTENGAYNCCFDLSEE